MRNITLRARSSDAAIPSSVPTHLNATELQRLVAQTAPKLYRLAARMVGLADAEDVLQESYARAFEALRSGEFEGRSRLETWLYSIVTRCALDVLRSTRRQSRREERAPEPHDEGRPLQAHAALRELSTWLEELPPEQRVALVLKEIEGLTSAEVARVLGTSEGAVEQKLVRARAALRARSSHE